MNKIELIKRLVEAETETLPLGFEDDPMGFILKKYPGLNNVMEYMMTKEFREFVDAIFVVAPKPTTFKVLLHNGQYFFLQFMGDTYQATVLGKNYYLKSIGEKERCMLAIARLLRYGTPLKTKGPEGGETGTEGGAEAGGLGGETTPTDTGGEEAGGEEAGGEALEESKIIEFLLRESIMEAPKKKPSKPQKPEEDYSDYIESLFKGQTVKVSKIKDDKYRVEIAGIKPNDRDSRNELISAISKRKPNVKKPKESGEDPVMIVTKGNRAFTVELKGETSPDASNTDVKEGLAVLAFYTSLSEPVTEKNYKQSVSELIVAGKNKGKLGYGLEDEKVKKIVEWLRTAKKGATKKYLDRINQSLSQALAIKTGYTNKDNKISRSKEKDDLYDKYRKLATEAFNNMDPDKWCPADLFVITDETIANQTYDALRKELDKNPEGINKIQFLQKLNSVFNNSWGDSSSGITGVSLKDEEAQLGKAKSFLKDKYAGLDKQYNVTKDEQNAKEKDLLKQIKEMQKNIANIVNARGEKDPSITYTVESGDIPKGKIRGKFAGLKALNFFFNQVGKPNQIDNALVELAQYAMSMTDMNPTYFKVTANKDGTAGSVKPFGAGTTIALPEPSKIEIIDSPGYKGVKIKMTLLKKSGESEETMSIQISAKTNGNTQGTIELENA